jgi:hypothetical protein
MSQAIHFLLYPVSVTSAVNRAEHVASAEHPTFEHTLRMAISATIAIAIAITIAKSNFGTIAKSNFGTIAKSNFGTISGPFVDTSDKTLVTVHSIY